MAQPGRPLTGKEKKDHLFNMKISPTEYTELRIYAESHGQSVAQVLLDSFREKIEREKAEK